MSDHGRFRKVATRTWQDARFRDLSPIEPSGQALWLYLLTGPHTRGLPGVFGATEEGMAAMLKWPLEAFREAFREVLDQGMAEADWDASLVVLPKAVIHNSPTSPNVVLGWRQELAELPECALRDRAFDHLRLGLAHLNEAYLQAFEQAVKGIKTIEKASAKPSGKPSGKPFGKPLAKPSWISRAIAEKEKEKEKEKEQDPPNPPLAGGGDPADAGSLDEGEPPGLDDPEHDDPEHDDPEQGSLRVNAEGDVEQGGTTAIDGQVTAAHQGGGAASDGQMTAGRKPRPKSMPFRLPDWVPAQAWADWEEARRRKRSPMTDRARELSVADLRKLVDDGQDATAVLEQSTKRGWLGLFVVRDRDQQGAPPGAGGSSQPLSAAGQATRSAGQSFVARLRAQRGEGGDHAQG